MEKLLITLDWRGWTIRQYDDGRWCAASGFETSPSFASFAGVAEWIVGRGR